MMKKILLLIFIAMPCVAYSGSFVRHGYLFHYDDTVTAKGSYQIAIGVSAGDDLTDWNAALITMGGEEWKYLTMYYSSISKSDARDINVGSYILLRGKFLDASEASAIFGIPIDLALPQYLFTSHKIISKFSVDDADGDCVPDLLDPTPNMHNSIFQLAKDYDCDGKLFKYTIMVDSEDGTQLNIGEPKEYVVNNSPNTNCTDIGAYAPVPVSAAELILELLCLQCTGDGFVVLDCSGGGNGTDPGDNGTNPGGGSGGGSGGSGNGTNPGGGSGGGSGGSGNGTNPGGGSGGGSGGSGNGTNQIANSTLFDVDEERRRAEKAKEEFFHAWDELKRKVSNSFSIDFDASERLPKWNWNIFGKIVVVDLNIYKDDLRYIGIMLVLVCFVIALFVVFGD